VFSPLLSPVSARVCSATAPYVPGWSPLSTQEFSIRLDEPRERVRPFSSERNNAREPIHLSQGGSSRHGSPLRRTGRLDGQACTGRSGYDVRQVSEDASARRQPRGHRTTSPEKGGREGRRGPAAMNDIDVVPLRATHSSDPSPQRDTHADRDLPHPCLLHSRDPRASHQQGDTVAIRPTTVVGDAVACSSERHTSWPTVRTRRSSARQAELCYREPCSEEPFMPQVDVQ